MLEWDFVMWSSEKKMEDKVVLGLKKFEKHCFRVYISFKKYVFSLTFVKHYTF